MSRVLLPVVLALLPHWGAAQADDPTPEDCRNIPYSQQNCVRALACVGTKGVWFDGAARGWDQGTVTGRLSTGETCSGTWTSEGPFGTGLADLTCDDGTTIGVVYYTQDNITGTVTGRGMTSDGRPVEVWTGERVLEFLSDATGQPILACGDYELLLS